MAHYDANTGNTTIAIGSAEREGSGRVTVTETGLWLLELETSDGALTVNYAESA